MPILLGLVIAQRWGLGELAAYTVANAITALFQVVVDWGATRALPRNLAKMSAGAADLWLAAANGFRIILAAAALLAGVVLALQGILEADVVAYLMPLFAVALLTAISGNAVGQRICSREMAGIGWGTATGLAIFSSLAAIVMIFDASPLWLVGAFAAGKVFEAAILLHGRSWVARVRLRGTISAAHSLAPFAVQAILGVLYARLAVFTVERMSTRAELGLFSLGASLQSALLLVPISFALLNFPQLTRLAAIRDDVGIRQLIHRYRMVSTLGVLCGLSVIMASFRFAGALMHVTPGGGRFVLAFASLALLSVFSTMAGFKVQAYGREGLAARLSFITLACAIAYQVAALRWLGLWGIVAAVAAAELTSVAVFELALRKNDR
jgi:O-antigen/teichoic acid export membrane protein